MAIINYSPYFDMVFLWLAASIIFIIIEALSFNLVTIWLAAGSLAAMISCIFTDSLVIQIFVFLIVTLILLIFTKPLVTEKLHRERINTNVDELKGETAIVSSDILPLTGGEVHIRGLTWVALAPDDTQVIHKNAKVIVTGVNGVKLIVRRADLN